MHAILRGRRNFVRVVCILLLSFLFLAGCAETQYKVNSRDLVVRLNGFQKSEGFTKKREFEIKFRRYYCLWGLIRLTDRTLDDLLKEETRPGDFVGNLQINEKYDFADGLVDTILYGLLRPYSVVVRGEIYMRSAVTEPAETKKVEGKDEGK